VRTIRLLLEYDGTDYAGWQYQPGERTVQGELEAAVRKLTGEQLRLEVAGRTDAGVHALGQVASFRTVSAHPAEVFEHGLNANLPADVRVRKAQDAPADFHPRKSATGKWYRYRICDGRSRPVLDRMRAWHLPPGLDLAAMRAAAGRLIGTYDFSSFRSSSCEVKDPVRQMRRIEVFRDGAGLVVIELWASGFLKQMARAIAGTLAEVGGGKRPAGEIAAVLAARDRRRAGVTAPAHGLFLVRVDY
jgi:tRNA pseudouridine38-40 synthase